ncbi:MAG: hypothetical protein MUF21_09560, partial [Gemmatimonadaceae bacterium]|nr:hypothetical protein [Gemmatimonadaceae bacterium]
MRDGIHGFVREAGFAWTIVDAHLPRPVASVRAAQASGAASPVRGSPVAVPARETRTGAGVLAAWAREIAAARATGALPPSVVALQSIARRSVDAGVTGDDRDVRPARVATQQWPMALATNGDATRASEALRLAQAAFTNGDAPFASPWPVFDDLEAFLRA